MPSLSVPFFKEKQFHLNYLAEDNCSCNFFFLINMTILFSFVWQITMSTNHTAIETLQQDQLCTVILNQINCLSVNIILHLEQPQVYYNMGKTKSYFLKRGLLSSPILSYFTDFFFFSLILCIFTDPYLDMAFIIPQAV